LIYHSWVHIQCSLLNYAESSGKFYLIALNLFLGSEAFGESMTAVLLAPIEEGDIEIKPGTWSDTSPYFECNCRWVDLFAWNKISSYFEQGVWTWRLVYRYPFMYSSVFRMGNGPSRTPFDHWTNIDARICAHCSKPFCIPGPRWTRFLLAWRSPNCYWRYVMIYEIFGYSQNVYIYVYVYTIRRYIYAETNAILSIS
jgi:hypothetical protein